MIETLRKKFILIAMCSLSLAMAGVILIVNITNYINVRTEIVEIKDYITSQKRGMKKEKIENAPESPDEVVNLNESEFMGKKERHFQTAMIETLYFLVQIRSDGGVSIDNLNELEDNYTEEELVSIVESALKKKASSGFCKQYYYAFSTMEDGAVRGVFLNCETRLASLRSLMRISLLAYIGGVLFAFFTVLLYSKRAIRPMEENLIQQKQFITNASHELKTPLTAISANMDVLTLEIGENEWIRGTQKQVATMRSLVNEMVYLSRLDEEGYEIQMEQVNFSKLVMDVTEAYQMMEEISGKQMVVDIQKELYVKGNEQALRRMVSELCNNAEKYAPYEDKISLTLKQVKNKVVLTIENGMITEMEDEVLNQLFNRFYRADESRSKNEKNGFGIGLSIVKAIVEKHGGSITAKRIQPDRIEFKAVL